MPRKTLIRNMIFLLLLMACSFAASGQEILQIDPAASEIHFTLSDVLHTVRGTFKLTEGSLQLRRSAGEMRGRIVVGAATGESGNNSRDHRMSESELLAQKYPHIVFEPDHFTGALAASGKSSIMVSGIFTLLGTGHPITVPMQVEATGDHYMATGSFTVPYVAWGLKDPSSFVLRVGKEVQIELKLIATLKH
jgi:polyisoprenoid-binding protein YceI